MKKIILVSFLFIATVSSAQSDSSIIKLSESIVFRMDSLLVLSARDREKIIRFTQMIYRNKRSIRGSLLSADPIELQKQLQRIENKRDSLYKIAMSDTSFKVYLDNKGYILSGYKSLPNN